MPVTASHADEAGLQAAGALWNNYGYHLKIIADYSAARNAYERALKAQPEHTTGINNLAGVYYALRDLEGARTMYERALKIDEANFGPDHPKVAIRVNNLGNVMKDLGDMPAARTAFERALKIDEANFGPPTIPRLPYVSTT